MTDFTELVDLASERLGGAAIAANDEFFAPKENLVKVSKPVFHEGEYTDRGKWMDGWETRRRREPGHDWCVVRLGLPGVISGVDVDTAFFRGNFPESCSIEAAEAEDGPWTGILPRSPLSGDAKNLFSIEGDRRSTHVKLHIYPDGGVARLRVYGRVTPDAERLSREKEVDLAALENGALVAAASDMFFGARHNLILPGPPRGMHDGWETRRRRGPGHDWAIVQLGVPGTIRSIEVDTTWFKGNAPGSCSVEVLDAGDPMSGAAEWREILAETPLRPDAVHRFDGEVRSGPPATHARLNIFPDGGVARLRLLGSVA
ncbi:MAG TPA: allantoicase [Thermoanaerobaculia bacterium]|jgi:allantoicase|nr:allantoicase [Thermoanaerobaculia bacterium]